MPPPRLPHRKDPPAPGGGQGRGGRQGGGFGRQQQISLATIPNDVLADNLKLTAEQKTKIAPIHEKYMTDTRALRPTPGGPQIDRETRRANNAKMRDLTEQANKDIDAILTDDQKKLVPDLIKDLQSFQAADLPFALRSKIDLTDEQKKKIAEAETASRDATRQKMQDARQSGDMAKMRDIQTEAMKDLHEKVMAVLTDDQKKLVEEYQKAHPRRATPTGRPGAGSDANA